LPTTYGLKKKRLEDAIIDIVFECRLRLGISRIGRLDPSSPRLGDSPALQRQARSLVGIGHWWHSNIQQAILIRTRVATSQQNCYAARLVKSIKVECLDHLIPFPYAPRNEGENGLVVKFERLGGLLNYYSRESESSKSGEEALTG
jgi:hypothetical protein